jgi:diguanylate cyclase (GGDEF)-like protein
MSERQNSEVIVGHSDVVVVTEPCFVSAATIAHLRDRLAAMRQEIDRLSALRHLVNRDDLTQLYNRRHFEERLTQEWSRAMRGEEILSVVIVDLDDFRLINDTAGHEVGDRVLRFVGQIMASTCREHDLAFRLGGDEFGYLLPGTGRSGAKALMKRLQINLETSAGRPWLPPGFEIRLTYGVAETGRNISSAVELVRAADWEMYDRKRLGNGRGMMSFDCVVAGPAAA